MLGVTVGVDVGMVDEVVEHGVHQALVGDGEQVRVEVGAQVSFLLPAAQLLDAKAFRCGITYSRYAPA